MITIAGIRYRNDAHNTSYRSCLPIYGSLSFLFLDDFEGNAHITVAIKYGSTVFESCLFMACRKYCNSMSMSMSVSMSMSMSMSMSDCQHAGAMIVGCDEIIVLGLTR